MSGESVTIDSTKSEEKRKRMSCALEIECPGSIQEALHKACDSGFHFIVTHIVHPRYARNLLGANRPLQISRTDRILTGTDWNRLLVGKLTPTIEVDSEIEHVRRASEAVLLQELGFASHLGIPAIMISLKQRKNANLARNLYNKIITGMNYQVWVHIPMTHPSQYSPLYTEEEFEDTWEWWNDFRRYCHYDKRLGLVLEMPDMKHIPTAEELERWMGEPVKAISLSTDLFVSNLYKQPVLPKVHQDVIQKFLALDVQYIVKGAKRAHTHTQYCGYINFLGKKLYREDIVTDFVHGCEDFLQNPLQPLTEHLETHVYEVFEKDQVKYVEYQNAIQKALEDLPASIETPVIMVVGAGRGPLVQAALNASYILHRRVKVYAVEKNPYAVNTLVDRVKNEWFGQVTLIHEDMRTYEPPEQADILVSELLGSFGDNELSPECLDGAQRFLKKETGISIPCSYTSFLAPLQSPKIYSEIRSSRKADDTMESCYETPYVVHLVNFYQIAQSQQLFKYVHPNWCDPGNNKRYSKLTFQTKINCLLTGFAGYFETVLYKDVKLSINPQTYSENMVSWFPIVFPIPEPVQVAEGQNIEVSFWRCDSNEKVWYEWCVEAPFKGSILNPGGRSYSIKKH